MTTWVYDDNNNRASVERWGSEEAARASLATLHNCSDCSDCSECSECSECSRCSGCLRCSECSDCSECSGRKNQANNKSASSVPVVPIISNIHQTVLAAVERKDCKLDMSDWHHGNFCGTTHCRAGWVTHLAGKAGKSLEDYWDSTSHAAWLIYKASDPEIEGRPNFFTTNEAAMADMRRLAEKEKAKS